MFMCVCGLCGRGPLGRGGSSGEAGGLETSCWEDMRPRRTRGGQQTEEEGDVLCKGGLAHYCQSRGRGENQLKNIFFFFFFLHLTASFLSRTIPNGPFLFLQEGKLSDRH